MTRQQAQQYFNSIPQPEQQAVLASGADLLDWANASEAAGDPRALRFSGTSLPGAGTGDIYGGQVATGGQPSTDWLGKRKPTPAELRAYGAGKSEDYLRFSDAQLAAWIASNWDVAAGSFKNDAGDLVGKPTDSGPLSDAAGWATGDKSTAGFWRGGDTGAGAAAPTSSGTTPASSGEQYNPLAQNLMNMFSTRAGYFADDPRTTADDKLQGRLLQGGGLWWGPTGFMQADASQAPAAGFQAPAAQPAPAPARQNIPIPNIPAGPINLPPNERSGAGIELAPSSVATSPLAQAILNLYPTGTRQWWDQDNRILTA